MHGKSMFNRKKKKKKLKECGCKEWCEESEGTIYKGEGI